RVHDRNALAPGGRHGAVVDEMKVAGRALEHGEDEVRSMSRKTRLSRLPARLRAAPVCDSYCAAHNFVTMTDQPGRPPLSRRLDPEPGAPLPNLFLRYRHEPRPSR